LSGLRAAALNEGKVSWAGLLDRRGVALRQAVSRQAGSIGNDFSTEGNAALALYLPIRRQRSSWKGDGDVLVAVQIHKTDPILAFSTNGESRALSTDSPPPEVVIAIVPAERENFRLSSSAIRLNVERSNLEECLKNVDECPGSGGPTPSYPPGIYATQMTVWDKAEPWIRGDPEIELALLGSVPERCYALAWPSPAAPDLAYRSGEILVPLGCAGRLAPGIHGGVKRFDFNGEDGTVYNRTLLIEERDEFGVEESVEGVYGAVRYSREAIASRRLLDSAWALSKPTIASPVGRRG